MSAPFAWKDQHRQPTVWAGLNPHAPFAKSVAFAWPLHLATIDAGNQANHASLQGGASRRGSYGESAHVLDGTDDALPIANTSPFNAITGAVSLLFRISMAADTVQTLFSFSNATTNNFFTLYVGNGVAGTLTNELITLGRATGGSSTFTLGYTTSDRSQLLNSGMHTILLCSDGATWRFFLDGVERTVTVGSGSNSGAFGGLAAVAANTAFIGGRNVGASLLPLNGAVSNAVIWTADVSSIARSLHKKPWQMYMPGPSKTILTPSAGGGATIAGALESLTLSTFGATVGSARAVAAALESLALTTSAARVSSDRAITASVESISLTTSQARIASDRAVSAATEQLTVTPAAASVALVAGIAAGTEALSVTANPATVALNASIAATLEAITVTGLTATVSTSSNTNISAALESITVTVNPATVSRDSALAAALESLTVTPHAASIAVGQIVAAALEGLMLTSYPAGIALDVAIAAQLEQINLATFAAQVGLGTNVAALTEALTLTPHGATITFAPSVGAATEHLTLTTFAAVVGATEAALLSPGLEFTIPLSRMGYTIPVSRVHFTIPQE